MSELISQVENLITPLMNQENIELVDLTYKKTPAGWTLSLYIDKPGGVTLDDCATWNQKIGDLLDQADLVSHAYSLEVSSPGLDRPLKKLADYQKFLGERVSVKLYAPLQGQKNFHGILKAASSEEIVVFTEEKNEVTLPLQHVAKSKLDPVINF